MLKIYIGPNGYGKSYRMSKDREDLEKLIRIEKI